MGKENAGLNSLLRIESRCKRNPHQTYVGFYYESKRYLMSLNNV